nr:RNA-directed DNA polymerase, eukaryota [Tanacetum cinerariifolium]
MSIYTPQQAAYKRVLWEYMSILLGRWNGDAILMGDFNEVRSREERHGSCFNSYSARVFDNFISSSRLVDIKMDGYAFTWSHPSALKMSKLDRFLVTDGLLMLFPSITAGVVFDYLISKRHEVTRQLQDIKSREAADFIQNSKVRWAIEGDENSKYFHRIINKKRSQ